MSQTKSAPLLLEIGHVLFIDIVGYSKLLIEEQRERLKQLTDIVLGTAMVREARRHVARGMAGLTRDE